MRNLLFVLASTLCALGLLGTWFEWIIITDTSHPEVGGLIFVVIILLVASIPIMVVAVICWRDVAHSLSRTEKASASALIAPQLFLIGGLGGLVPSWEPLAHNSNAKPASWPESKRPATNSLAV
jgi:hypothetical protein